MVSGSEFVTLRGGLTVPIAPILLLLDLESRGVTVELDGADLFVWPRQRVTHEDYAQLRRWKRHLLALVTYEPPEI